MVRSRRPMYTLQSCFCFLCEVNWKRMSQLDLELFKGKYIGARQNCNPRNSASERIRRLQPKSYTIVCVPKICSRRWLHKDNTSK
ncbi:uncharacterized protein LOC120087216 isoform X2 [Benincasa hispida]|uniref:uncharacterized protein LOC120087216 isoform X2 n=1 Tax=Benincasa hispida TaxID=102211 RepID=UPI0018FFB63C|nr:uncharacterized protein LOC120087216 isoform X2 [Benincasa hispida]